MTVLAMLMSGLLMQAAPSVPSTPLPDVEVQAAPRTGTVELECVVNAYGRLRDCVVLSENPPGHGFGDAALQGARRARINQSDVRGSDEKIRFTTRFRLER